MVVSLITLTLNLPLVNTVNTVNRCFQLIFRPTYTNFRKVYVAFSLRKARAELVGNTVKVFSIYREEINLTSPLLTTKTVCKVKMFLCKRVIVWLTHSGGIVENSQECVECFHVMHYSVLCSVGTYRQARSLQCQTIHKAIKPLSLFLSSLNYCLF